MVEDTKGRIELRFVNKSFKTQMVLFSEAAICEKKFQTISDLQYEAMVEYFNKRSLLSGNIPLGSINSILNFTGSKQNDAASSKSLAMDGFFIPLCKVQLMKSPLVLQGKVKQAIPSLMDPSALAKFSDTGSHASSGPMKFKDNKGVDPGLFNSQGIYPQPPGAPYLAGKKYGTICTFSKSTLSIMHFNSPVYNTLVCI
ncbi:hypothetical protein NE237_027070 [Protea cynaroides]|uniref:Uncharacterized protein n=1 Tax=Protea cynaroides TaxID=273540 RepID=A0A9Q0JU27_9MAGN|nr:hypothetical protein NE237_027070 [Protea cynaroides]